MKKAIIIGDKIGVFDPPEGFGFLSYFYLHGQAEDLNEFDCCYGNMEAFQRVLTCHLSACEIQLQNGSIHDGIIIPMYEERRLKGLICLCSDHESVRHAIFEYHSGRHSINTCMEDSEKSTMYGKYPEIFNIIREYNRSK